MKLKVPMVKQKRSGDCGPACLAMLMKYYSFDTSVSRVNKELGNDGWQGMSPFKLGSYLLSKLLDVEIVTFDATVLVKADEGKKLPGLLKRIGKVAYFYEEQAKLMGEFAKSGGSIKFRIPTLDDLAEEIASNRPVIVDLTNRFVLGKDPRFNLHFNLVTGIDDKYVYVNDPFYGGVEYSLNDFLFGVYASSAKAFCSFIKVREDLLNYR